jgi:hypothetical protein
MRLRWTTVASTTAASLLLFFAGCETVPVADGFHTALPTTRTVIAVWGNHPAVTAAATTWLLHQDLMVLEQAKLQQLVADAQHPDARMFKEAAVLQAAKSLGVRTVLFITQTGDMRAPMVAVRGVDVETTHVLWSGTARYPQYVQRPFSDLLVNLTCQALAVAWGRDRDKKEPACGSSAQQGSDGRS